jgi:phosphotransferase system  glucose/maltose/N-acetylglucosamine-specific IIC component
MDKTRKKTIVFSLLVAAGMLLFVNQSVQAQDRSGGLLGYDGDIESHSFFGKGESLFSWAINEEDFGTTPEGDINVEDFGTPVGSGMLILLAAGAGYATLKRKKTNH